MSWLVFDCPSGISGDMTLGALVDLGIPLEGIQAALATLPLGGYTLRHEVVHRNAIAATQVSVELDHAHEHAHRHLYDVLAILEAGTLRPRALRWAKAVFQRLAEAEAAVHRTTIEAVHFHEVGAVDAIVDIAGACVALDLLHERHDVTDMWTGQLRLGRGNIKTEHGMMPVPAPATLHLLQGFPVQFGEVEGERVTPTGAAILAALTKPLHAVIRPGAVGYGAGSRHYLDTANVLRLVLCEPAQPASRADVSADTESGHRHPQVAVLRTTIDDMVPEFFGHLMQAILDAGALDVFYTPVLMKKGRPATHVTVVAEPPDVQKLAAVLLNESTTLGVRVQLEDRVELPRRAGRVSTQYGDVEVKIARRPDGRLRVVPEYESVRRVAKDARVPLLDVYASALRVEGMGSESAESTDTWNSGKSKKSKVHKKAKKHKKGNGIPR